MDTKETESKHHATNRPAAKVEGHCNCGQVTVSVLEPAFIGATAVLCHCTNCRRSTGSTCSYNLVLKPSDFQVEGQTSIYRDQNTVSGNVAARQFCTTCGSPIQTWIEGKEESGPIYFKGSLFSPKQLPKPVAEVFTKNMEEWEIMHEGVQSM